jgi:hypothetical protein
MILHNEFNFWNHGHWYRWYKRTYRGHWMDLIHMDGNSYNDVWNTSHLVNPLWNPKRLYYPYRMKMGDGRL